MLEHGIDAPDAGEDPAASVLKPADADVSTPANVMAPRTPASDVAATTHMGDGVAQPFRALLIARTGLDRRDGEKGANEPGKDAFAMLGFEHVRCAFGAAEPQSGTP